MVMRTSCCERPLVDNQDSVEGLTADRKNVFLQYLVGLSSMHNCSLYTQNSLLNSFGHIAHLTEEFIDPKIITEGR